MALYRLRALVFIGAFALGCAEGIDPPEPTPVEVMPAGSFLMGFRGADGCGQFETRDGSALLGTEPRIESARAVHTVEVRSFCIDAHEVTNAQYRHCVARGDCGYPQSTNAGNRGQDGFIAKYYTDEAGYDDHPVLGVGFADAQKYCAFRGGYLPTEAQWEYAARSAGRRDRVWSDPAIERLVPDGCQNDPNLAGSIALGSCADGVEPVMGSPGDVTAQGLFDMAGNAAEWVADDFDFFAYCADTQPDGASLSARFEVDGRRPLPVISADWIADPADPALTVDGETYGGACLDAFTGTEDRFGCIDHCAAAFGDGDGLSRQQAEWQRRVCAAQVGVDPEDAGALPPRDAEGCDAACTAFHDCFDTPPVAPESGAACLQTCQRTADACILAASVPGTTLHCAQLESGRNCRPTPWCVPREGFTAETVHIRLDALTSEPLRGTKGVRGGHFQSTRACEGFPAWRGYELESSPLVGFRCAFDRGTARCPAE